ncbi:hypothetical protein PF006_g19376 [Phytophthora fragariae]|uniref:ZSWIM1/3 RNaseH-like domain-containing protein n=1 Tax=Phytophthora fragariae TaxID=53985 RepID=A0A6A3E8R2_9STRA|nr:hypothetical protein PF009_g21162 [Phytophthora fragariae]KAE9115003.1 hypothetical protein PF006_g19376 [Phytophthora fragariae]KAE9199069.1 hypothetical protein PF004_g19369 [Phytophthora fragariae]
MVKAATRQGCSTRPEYSTACLRRKFTLQDSKPVIHIRMVRRFVGAGTAFRQIYRYVAEHSGKPVIFKDVRNMIQDIQNEVKQECVEERVRSLLDEFRAEESGNVARICKNSDSVATCIVFQTTGMPKMFSLFPEVLLVDSTHKTNDLRYKLFSFMITDAYGKGQFAQHALVDQETDANMELAVEAFQENNKDWAQVAVIMVDKDLTEIGVLEKKFPNARVLLCRFHVLKWFRQIRTDDRFALSRVLQNEMLLRIKQMVYSKSASDYEAARDELFDMLEESLKPNATKDRSKLNDSSDKKSHPFIGYFNENWESCRRRWVEYLRTDTPHLGNNTNNRIESGWSKMKPELNADTPLDQCIETVLTLQMFKEKEFERHTNVVGEVIHAEYDAEMAAVLTASSPYVAGLIFPEYAYATKVSTLFYTRKNVRECFASATMVLVALNTP